MGLQEGSKEPLQQIMLARYYSSSLGRFMAVDPALAISQNVGIPQRWNRYTYALNNPLKFVDPDGRDVELSPGMQRLVTDNKQFRTAWNAFRSSTAGKKYFDRVNNDHSTKVIVRAASDKSFDRTGDGIGDAYGTTTVTKGGRGAHVQEQAIDMNFEDTGGAAQLALSFLDEFVHAAENVRTNETTTQDQDHALREKERQDTDFDGEVRGSLSGGGAQGVRGFGSALSQYADAADARKKELEAQGKW